MCTIVKGELQSLVNPTIHPAPRLITDGGTSISHRSITCTSILHINAVRKCYVSRQTNGEERQDEYLTDFSVLHGFH